MVDEMLKETWNNSGVASRSGLIGGVVAILVISILAAWWLLHSRNGVLFTDLEPGDAAAVVSELERMKVSYTLAADGTRILVPQDEVHEIRLKLVGSGVPLSGSVGFELFDKAEFGMTEFAQRINFQRAMQGELTRTITSLKEVKFARVHLVMPEASLFQKNKTSPSASVTLFVKSGAQLDQQQTKGIQRLVSASVPGLEASAVTIVDQNGKTMSALVEDENGPATVTTRLQKKKEVEAYLIEKTARVLERAFGPGKAIVSIDATLNFDQSKTTREEVIPGSDENRGMVRKRESRTQTGSGKKRQKGGGEVNTEIEYRLGRSVEQIVSTPGDIERLSVGVLVPASSSEAQLKQIEDLVAMAVGLDRMRGDAIAVHSAAGELLPHQQAEMAAESQFTNEPMPADISGHQSSIASTDDVWDQAGLEQGQMSASANPTGGAAAWIYAIWAKHTEAVLAIGLALVLLVLLTIVLISKAGRKRANQRRLLVDERERILNQLKTWINADELAPQSEGKSS
ncbi:flagellar basal-body MS-ring/collar protein FliF [Candidatus Thiodiazotropha sp. CDECU1]|uniref:flagellar basal-body MS-ring/collar protein FliF n=1 Tax=Candidatus Thiodiazotropha sp. CDECU1 TaxID=3065865 RepID=UPI00292DF5F8|nr:flagellar basal-body MS-ring/collar protein FliF [Candidatus Thiodiazotropha sp. CDECU1]